MNIKMILILMIGTLICDTTFLLLLTFGLFGALCICCKEIYDGKEVECNLPSKSYNKVIQKDSLKPSLSGGGSLVLFAMKGNLCENSIL